MAYKKTPFQKTERKLIAQTNPRSPIAEQYRTIRTNINFSLVDRELRSLLVTSAGPVEGKSTTAANLAIVYAQQGKRVLLVDADMRRPTIHYTFHLVNMSGLTTILTGKASLKKAVQESKVENLDILTCGPIPPNPAEMLSSQAMMNFFTKVHEQYDLVIFDTPPVLAVTDAQVLADKCDGTVLVVSSGKTDMEEAVKTKELLAATKTKLLGVILNNKKMLNENYYHYYGVE